MNIRFIKDLFCEDAVSEDVIEHQQIMAQYMMCLAMELMKKAILRDADNMDKRFKQRVTDTISMMEDYVKS